MEVIFEKKIGHYSLRFSQKKPHSKENRKNAVIYFDKNGHVIGIDIYQLENVQSY